MTAGAWQAWLMIGATSFGPWMPDDRHTSRFDSSSRRRGSHHVPRPQTTSPGSHADGSGTAATAASIGSDAVSPALGRYEPVP
jgi:hypothetical protein